MSEISVYATYLIENILTPVIYENRVRLPYSFKTETKLIQEIVPKIRTQIKDSGKSCAMISKKDWVINLTTAWLCQRWCSAYGLLLSVNEPKAAQQFFEVQIRADNFVWPKNVPDPTSTDDTTVDNANKLFPYLFATTILHEIGHAVHCGNLNYFELELACDHFAICYLLDDRPEANRNVVMLGLAVWFCCLCSESLDSCAFTSATHPNPVTRMERFLKEFVPNEGDVGNAIWMMCVGHVMRLARFHNRSSLDEDVLGYAHHNLEALLGDLKSCW
jgi:hypothetical protein